MDFRNDELVRENSNSLRALAGDTVSGNRALVTIAVQSMADSRIIKIATMIGVIYLPASLVTVSIPVRYEYLLFSVRLIPRCEKQSFFSTSLVEFNSEHASITDVKIRKEIWILVVVSLFFMSLSMVSAFFEERRQRNIDQPTLDLLRPHELH